MLIRLGLLAYQRPLYQVLALEPAPTRGASPPEAEEQPVDIKAVFARIGEVLA